VHWLALQRRKKSSDHSGRNFFLDVDFFSKIFPDFSKFFMKIVEIMYTGLHSRDVKKFGGHSGHNIFWTLTFFPKFFQIFQKFLLKLQ
jgi:hypothetical protein